jgi:hypothetical protein
MEKVLCAFYVYFEWASILVDFFSTTLRRYILQIVLRKKKGGFFVGQKHG